MCGLRGTPGILSPSAQKYVGFQLRRRERMVTPWWLSSFALPCQLPSQPAAWYNLSQKPRVPAAFPSPHLTLARALAQATTLERAGAFCSWILGVMFQESLLLMGVELSETHGFGIQRSIRFWQSSALSEHRTMCISGSDKSCLTLPRLERPCQFCQCSPDVVFTGATTAGLYISFAEEGTVTGAM